MICRVDGTVRTGRVVSLDRRVAPETVATAVREGTAGDGDVSVSIAARTPHPVHERVGCLRPGMGLRVRTALAAAARARGWTTRYDAELRRTRATLDRIEADSVDTDDTRRAVAAARTETDRLRERVATVRGRLLAREELGLDPGEAGEHLRETARDLSEAETTAAAARQRLDRERRRARTVRDALERRLRLEDEVANLERRARAALAERARGAYASALVDVPGGPESVPTDPFGVDPLDAGLAVARVAGFDAPVVLACDRFESPRAASRWLGAPVVEI